MEASRAIRPVFDDPNVVSAAGLVSLLRPAETGGLQDLLAEHLTVRCPNAVVVTRVVAGC